MHRPYVQVSSTNQVCAMRRHLDTVLPRLAALPGVVGITLNGGMARGYADHLSEVDITLYLEPAAYAAWQRGQAPVTLGITIIEGLLYDLKAADIDAEQARTWDPDALWDASYAEVLHDPDGRVARLLQGKVTDYPTPDAAEGYLFGCWWNFRLAGDIWIHRGDVLQGHHVFNHAVELLVKALFVANREYVPHEKWLIHMSRSLAWTPEDWGTRLCSAMQTGDMTEASLRLRQTEIASLWDEIDGYVRRGSALPVHMMQKTVYDLLSLLVDKQSIALDDWQARTSLALLNRDPFRPIVRIEADRIVLDRDKLLHVQPHAMYAWHDEIVRAIVDQTGGQNSSMRVDRQNCC